MTKSKTAISADFQKNVMLTWDQALIIARQAAAIALSEFTQDNDPHKDYPNILKSKQVGEILNISPAYVSFLAKTGRLQNVSKDRHLRFKKAEVLQYAKHVSRNCPG